MKNSAVFILLLLIVLITVILTRPAQQVIVQDSPVKFSSVRKHPFDVYADPYHPPEMDNPYMVNRDYQQVGFLQGEGRAGFLPLFGRPSPHNRSKWEYYTQTDGIKLPVAYKGRQCYDNGCDEINTKDNINVDGLGTYKSQLYDVKQLTR